MRPKKHKTTGSNDLFRTRLDQIINMKHELVVLAGRIDWDWIDGEIAPLYSENGRPGIETRCMIGLLLLKHIYGLSDEGVCERRVHDPYFQFFTGKEFFQHAFPIPKVARITIAFEFIDAAAPMAPLPTSPQGRPQPLIQGGAILERLATD